MKKNFIFGILLTSVLLCGCEEGAEMPSEISETASQTAAATAEYVSETSETTVTTTAETEAASPFENSEFYQYIQEWNCGVSFCDLDLDGHYELLLRSFVGGRSFNTDFYRVYKLNDTEPKLYGYISLESGESRHIEHTTLEGKLYRYYDKEQGVYKIIGDATLWDDFSFGNIQYYIKSNTLYSDKIQTECLDEFSGTDCYPAEFIRNAPNSDPFGFDYFGYVYDDKVVDLNSTEKFLNMPDILQEYEFIDTIDLDALEKYTDIDKIMELVCEYSGYENTNEVSAPDDDNGYIGIIMGNHKIFKSDTEVYLEIRNIDELDWNKICEIEDLHKFVLDYLGEDEIDIDLSPLKKYNNLTFISILGRRGNISKNTKRQISEFPNLEYVDMWDILISSEEDFEYIKDLPKLKYIAVASDNDDPDYFKFLYDNKSIEWIRFDSSVTDEQIKRTIDNMPNIEAVTFGFSEV